MEEAARPYPYPARPSPPATATEVTPCPSMHTNDTCTQMGLAGGHRPGSRAWALHTNPTSLLLSSDEAG